MNELHQIFPQGLFEELRSRFRQLSDEQPKEKKLQYVLSHLDTYFVRLWGFWRSQRVNWTDLRESAPFCCVVVAAEELAAPMFGKFGGIQLDALRQNLLSLGSVATNDERMVGEAMTEFALTLISLNQTYLDEQ